MALLNTCLAAIARQREVDAGDAVVVKYLEDGHGGVGDARRVGPGPGHQHRGSRHVLDSEREGFDLKMA